MSASPEDGVVCVFACLRTFTSTSTEYQLNGWRFECSMDYMPQWVMEYKPEIDRVLNQASKTLGPLRSSVLFADMDNDI